MRSCSCQSPDHKPDHADANHSFTVIQSHLVVAAESARFEKPPESAFHDPAFRQDLEAFDLVTAANNFQSQFAKGTQLLDPVHQGAQIAAVGPDDLQPSIQAHQHLDQRPRRVAVLHRSGCDHHKENQTQAIDRDVALASGNLFACVITALSCLIGRFNRLAVDDGRSGRNGTSFSFAHTVPKHIVNKGPSPILAPSSEVAVKRLPRSKVVGQQSPRAARTDHIEDSVQQGAALQLDGRPRFPFPDFGTGTSDLIWFHSSSVRSVG